MTKRIVTATAALLMLSGCASTTTVHYALDPRPNGCSATESRPTWQSNVVAVVCWDAAGKAIGMAGGSGTSTAAVTTSMIGSTATLVQSAATLGAGALIADGLKSAAKSIPTEITANTTGTVSGNVTTTGTVGGVVSVGAIPTVNVAPVTGSLSLVPVMAP